MMLYSYKSNANRGLDLDGVVEDPESVVWTERWQDYGECEVTVPASEAPLVAVGRFLVLEGRRMACEVVKLLVQDGKATATGRDALWILDRRIIVGTSKMNGKVEDFARSLISSWITPSSTRLPVVLGPSAGIADTANLQRSWKNVGQACLDLARDYGFGLQATMATASGSRGHVIQVYCAESQDRGLVLSRDIGNVASERILDDASDLVNYVYIGAGDDEDGRRYYEYFGRNQGTGLDFHAQFVDRRDAAVVVPFVSMAEWGDPYGCADATSFVWGFSDGPQVVAEAREETVGYETSYRITAIYARIPMLFYNQTVACARIRTEDFSEILPAKDSAIRAALTMSDTFQAWALT